MAMTDAAPIRRSPVPPQLCNLARSFELIGDRWTLLILRSALYGIRRFDDFQADLDIPRSVLSQRLAALVAHGLMERQAYRDEGQRRRIEYPLTEMGQALALPFMAITAWGDDWLGNGKSPLTLRSKSSGQKLSVALVDENGKAVKRSDIERIIELDTQPDCTKSIENN
jgi:DNA-binding HxlR family transcriptional regulator